jgi:hypothetical protein
MQIKVSLAISGGTAEPEALPLLTLEVDAQPSIETLGLGLADAKALLARIQAPILMRQVELMSTSQRRCAGCGLNRAIKDYHDDHYRSLFASVAVKVPLGSDASVVAALPKANAGPGAGAQRRCSTSKAAWLPRFRFSARICREVLNMRSSAPDPARPI